MTLPARRPDAPAELSGFLAPDGAAPGHSALIVADEAVRHEEVVAPTSCCYTGPGT